MIRTCLRVMRRYISTHRIDLTPKQIRKDFKLSFYPIVGIRQRKLGACIFNQPSNQNLLTEQFCDQLYRFLLSYQYDNTIQNIFIQTKDNIFSHGLDYKRMSEDTNYLDKIMKLAILIARFNKPIFGQISGGAKGAGAYLLSMLNMPFGYKNAYLKLDQCSRGMVPMFGGSHRMARLPLKLGYYLALTGDQLNAEEMAQLDFIKGSIELGVTNQQIREKFHEANLYFREKFRYMDFDGENSFLEAEEQVKVEQKKERYYSQLKYFQTQLLSESPRNLNVKFAANQHIAAKVDYQNVTNPFNTFSEDTSGRTINNYFEMRLRKPLQYLKEHDLVTEFDIRGVELKRIDVGMIDQIFSKNSVEEIMEALKQEQTQWAQKAYRRMKGSDPLALILTFQLLKKAQSQPWIECLQLQYSVARRLLSISDISLRTFQKSSHYIYTNDYSNKPLSQIPTQLIQSFFAPPPRQFKLEHDVKPHSLIPVNDYYKEIPDSVRKYLNCEEFVDKHNFQQLPEIMRFLKAEKINYKSQVYDVNVLRKKVYEKLEMEKEKERVKKRLEYLAAHDTNLERYRLMRQSYLETVDEEQLKQSIDAEVRKVFQEKFENRFAAFEQKTAPILGLESKISLFKKIKDIILKNLLYNGYQYEREKFGKSDYTGPIYFDKEGKDIYSSKNHFIQQDQALRQLSVELSTKDSLSEQFEPHQDKPLPKFYGTNELKTAHEKQNEEMWDKIKFRYDQKPELWAEAYTYKELIIQASRTSEELAGYLEWNYESFYDLLNYTEKMGESYGEFAVDMTSEVARARYQKLEKLSAVSSERQEFLKKGLFDKLYKWKQQAKMRQIFPYYFKQSVVPGQFRRSFLSILDSTLKQFTSIYGARSKHDLLVKQQLGVLDRWINNSLANQYTEFLHYDVQYVSSYLQILFVKEMLTEQIKLDMAGKDVEQLVEHIKEKFNVDFGYKEEKVTMKSINKSITTYLYFLVDMHIKAKRHIQSPQSKLLDFVNRLKVNFEFDVDYALPYSFEGLLLLIGKDRKKIYDRFLGEAYISEPQFLLEYITRESKKQINPTLTKHTDVYPEQMDKALEIKHHMHRNGQLKTKKLIQNYFYYMMMFEKRIHIICGKENFIPDKYVPEEDKVHIDYAKKVISPDENKVWYQKEVRAVIEQLLNQREEIEKKLTKAELYLYDRDFMKKLESESIRQLIRNKLTEEVFIIKNMFADQRQYDFKATTEQQSDFEYTKTKRLVKNRDALKKLNNLSISQQIYLEYMSRKQDEEEQDMLPEEKRFANNQMKYYKDGFTTRLPFKSYHRMSRDVFVYPEEMVSVPSTEREVDLFKKINIKFEKSLAGEKIELSNFTSEYKELNKKMKNSILEEMADKISKVESL